MSDGVKCMSCEPRRSSAKGEDLPVAKGEDLPVAKGEDLPLAKGEDLPVAKGENLPDEDPGGDCKC